MIEAIPCPTDVQPFHRAETQWFRFSHGRLSPAQAIIGVDRTEHPPRMILHWICGDPDHPGRGQSLLTNVNAYADRHGLLCSLVCMLDVVPFYQRNGWVHVGPFLSLHQMARVPQ